MRRGWGDATGGAELQGEELRGFAVRLVCPESPRLAGGSCRGGQSRRRPCKQRHVPLPSLPGAPRAHLSPNPDSNLPANGK